MQITLFDKKDHTMISTIEWKTLMKRIRDGYWREIVERSRKESIGRDELKKRLPAFGASVTFIGGDEAANVVKYNHIISIDFNKVITDTNNGIEKIASCREICHNIPSVAGFYITKSGRGFRVFVAVNTGIDEHKIIYHPLQEYFEHQFGLQADDKYKDITQLSFVSYDPDCYYKNVEDCIPFVIENIIPFKNKSLSKMSTIGSIIQDVKNYLDKRYDFRFDILSRQLQYRIRPCIKNVISSAMKWTDVNDRLNDEIVKEINSSGIEITYNQFKWMIDNKYIAQTYDPICVFDRHLPEWDGEDRISTFAAMLKTDDKQAFTEDLKKWLVNMYKAWMNKNRNLKNVLILHSNTFHTEKTTWATNIIPPSLRHYIHMDYAGRIISLRTEHKQNLLNIGLDYTGDFKDIDMMTSNSATIITTSCSISQIHFVHQEEIKLYHINKNDGNVTAPVIDYPEFYAQVKILAKV